MNKIEELIQKLCPNGIEYKTLGDVAEVGTGRSNANESEENGIYPFFIRSKTIKYKNDYEYDEEALIIPGEGGIGDIFHYIKGKYALHQRVYRIHFVTDAIDVKFIYYYMQKAFKSFIMKKAVNATVTSIRKGMITDFPIPIPPIEVQQEIVRILDKFSTLSEKLNRELELRKKQYEHYREKILHQYESNTFLLGEVMDVTRGASPRPITKYITTDKNAVNWIKIGDVSPESKYVTSSKEKITQEGAEKSRFLHKGDFILSNSMSFGRPYILKIEGCIHDGWISLTNYESKLLPDFLYHFLKSAEVQKYWQKSAVKGAVSNLNADIVRKTPILVPSLAEQERIVSILDKFDTLINDQEKGLPAEIRKVQQQYEYYRDKLLTF